MQIVGRVCFFIYAWAFLNHEGAANVMSGLSIPLLHPLQERKLCLLQRDLSENDFVQLHCLNLWMLISTHVPSHAIRISCMLLFAERVSTLRFICSYNFMLHTRPYNILQDGSCMKDWRVVIFKLIVIYYSISIERFIVVSAVFEMSAFTVWHSLATMGEMLFDAHLMLLWHALLRNYTGF